MFSFPITMNFMFIVLGLLIYLSRFSSPTKVGERPAIQDRFLIKDRVILNIVQELDFLFRRNFLLQDWEDYSSQSPDCGHIRRRIAVIRDPIGPLTEVTGIDRFHTRIIFLGKLEHKVFSSKPNEADYLYEQIIEVFDRERLCHVCAQKAHTMQVIFERKEACHELPLIIIKCGEFPFHLNHFSVNNYERIRNIPHKEGGRVQMNKLSQSFSSLTTTAGGVANFYGVFAVEDTIDLANLAKWFTKYRIVRAYVLIYADRTKDFVAAISCEPTDDASATLQAGSDSLDDIMSEKGAKLVGVEGGKVRRVDCPGIYRGWINLDSNESSENLPSQMEVEIISAQSHSNSEQIGFIVPMFEVQLA